MEESPSTTDVPPAIWSYLAGNNVLTLATASPSGLPHSAMFLYVNDEMTFYVWSRPDTATVRHVEGNPQVSFTVGEYSANPPVVKGVQVSGEGRIVLDAGEVRRAVELFEAKFPGLLPPPPTNLEFLRIRALQVHFIERDPTHGGSTADQSEPATTFPRRLVYNVFGGLPEHTARTISGRLRELVVPAGEVVVRQGAPAERFFIIVDGMVEVLRSDNGEPRLVATLGTGQFFGEVAILRDLPRTATVRTKTETTLLALEREEFVALVAQSLGTTTDFDEIVRSRLAGLGSGEDPA